MSSINTFKFSLLGCEVEFRSSYERKYMEDLFLQLENKILTTQEKFGVSNFLKTAIITAYLLQDELQMSCQKDINAVEPSQEEDFSKVDELMLVMNQELRALL